jgi:hypothetical protein
VHAELQQIPSTQNPLWHWLAVAQEAPFARSGMHAPVVSQNAALVQSWSVWHPDSQNVPVTSHAPGEQLICCWTPHAPAPLQNASARSTPAVQLAAAHTTLPLGTGALHVPALHTSNVQTFPSLAHGVSSATAELWHPRVALQTSVVHASPSSHAAALGVPVHAPAAHVSFSVQGTPSLHVAVLFANMHPVLGAQVSVVHTFPSLHVSGVPPTHTPAWQVSTVVHALPSSQDAVLFVCWHPPSAVHVSVVHGFRSSQLVGAPPVHAPAWQASPVVHASPSSQATALSVNAHPVAPAQTSSVHALPSLQTSGAPPTHEPPWHVSAVVHASPSLHEALLFVNTHPTATSQPSSVHGFPSAHVVAGPGWHTPAKHVSAVVHAFPSSHTVPTRFVFTQPVVDEQESVVHAFASSQFRAVPPVQAPPRQASPVVHAFPSLHAALLFVKVHPVALSQASSVQTFPSSQTVGLPGWQVPPEQASDAVHASPSLHGAPSVTGVVWHPTAGSHESTEHGLPSSHVGGMLPEQTPEAHASTVVQAFRSSHGVPSPTGELMHPVSESQESAVQAFPSSHAMLVPAQVPAVQTSVAVQAFASLQPVPVSGEQSPSVPAALHAWQSFAPPVQAESQQKPSTQRPLVHIVARLQGAPAPGSCAARQLPAPQ